MKISDSHNFLPRKSSCSPITDVQGYFCVAFRIWQEWTYWSMSYSKEKASHSSFHSCLPFGAKNGCAEREPESHSILTSFIMRYSFHGGLNRKYEPTNGTWVFAATSIIAERRSGVDFRAKMKELGRDRQGGISLIHYFHTPCA